MNKRKMFALIAAGGLIGTVGTIAVQGPVQAQRRYHDEPHPRMVAAIQQLQAARSSLEGAAQDYHGHRVRAIELINRAISEVQEGIASDHDNDHR